MKTKQTEINKYVDSLKKKKTNSKTYTCFILYFVITKY